MFAEVPTILASYVVVVNNAPYELVSEPTLCQGNGVPSELGRSKQQ